MTYWPKFVFILIVLCSSYLYANSTKSLQALFQLKTEKDSTTWLEGFKESKEGKVIRYRDHEAVRRPVLILRKDQVSWMANAIPDGATDKVKVLFSVGYESKKGVRRFEFGIGKHKIQFKNMAEPSWSVKGPVGSRLDFKRVRNDRWGDHFGYMTLHCPKAWLINQPILSIKTLEEKPASWFMIFNDTDVLRENRIKANKKNALEIDLKVWFRPTYANKELSLVIGEKVIATLKPELKEGVAQVALALNRAQQNLLPNLLSVKSGSKTISKQYIALNPKRERAYALVNESIEMERYIFKPGPFPKAQWKRPFYVQALNGESIALKTRYFDDQGREVQKAERSGRYGAVVEFELSKGKVSKRYKTLYAIEGMDEDRTPYSLPQDFQIGLTASRFFPGSGSFNQVNSGPFYKYWNGILNKNIIYNEGVAIALAGLNQSSVIDPELLDRQWWVTKKAEIHGVKMFKPLKIKKSEEIFNDLSDQWKGQENESIFHQIDEGRAVESDELSLREKNAISRYCYEWVKDTGIACSVILIQKDQLLFKESFGTREDQPISRSTPTWMASITKLMAGVMMMKFVDQGLVDLDQPISDYLPEFLHHGKPSPLTIRHLYTHTNGLWGHGTWNGDLNHSLEEIVSQIQGELPVGEFHQYNGIGYGIAGKIMERITGQAYPILIKNHILGPLGMKHTQVKGTASDMLSVSEDIAKLGLLLLHEGKYNHYEAFKPETFKKMLPVQLSEYYSKIAAFTHSSRTRTDWGIGTVWFNEDGFPKGTFAHGAASGAILRVDPVNQVVLVMARHEEGPQYRKRVSDFIKLVTSSLFDKKK